MKALASLLKEPYPYYYQQQDLPKVLLGVFLVGFGFIYFFEPFNVEVQEHRMGYFWISLIHAGLASLEVYLIFTVLNLLKIREEQWTVGREMFSLALVLLSIGIGSFLIRDLIYDNPHNWSMGYLLEEIRNAFLIGLLLVFILVPLNYSRIYRKNAEHAAAFEPGVETEKEPKSEVSVRIETMVKSDNFTLDLENFLFAKAEGNYLEFYLMNGQKELKRLTMKELEVQLQDFPWILKTHRSYLVNTRKITKVAGNAQGYQLSLSDFPQAVPVSRGMISAFDLAIGQHRL